MHHRLRRRAKHLHRRVAHVLVRVFEALHERLVGRQNEMGALMLTMAQEELVHSNEALQAKMERALGDTPSHTFNPQQRLLTPLP